MIHVGNLDARRDLTDVRDVVRAYTGADDRGVTGEIYNVASGVGRVRSARSSTRSSRRAPSPCGWRSIRPASGRSTRPALIGDASKLRALTGWTPLIPFEQMMTDLLTYWRAHTWQRSAGLRLSRGRCGAARGATAPVSVSPCRASMANIRRKRLGLPWKSPLYSSISDAPRRPPVRSPMRSATAEPRP